MNDQFTQLTVKSSNNLSSDYSTVTFANGRDPVLIITADGKLIPGMGMSLDQISVEVFDAMSKYFETSYKRLCVENEQLKARIKELENAHK